ncbi:serine/threonine-protein kinase [Amycolatopsis sp. NPDC051102]|uniref:serine/threonine-protein kinase n=1 Tax=Amycolatopsis sp. NPDC051102 TaxID=3155163 RepID=UPI003444606F
MAGKLAGRYRLLETVGDGSGGTVWRAHDELLDRPVAVRRPPPGCPFDAAHPDRVRARVIREAHAATRLRHPHLLVVHDVFEHEFAPYVVTEHLAARTLAERLAREGSLPPDQVARLGAQLASALAAAHASGIVHRGIGPDHVLLTDGGAAKLGGFGLGPGSPLAPDAASPAFAADVRSLGVTLYCALEGRPPGSAVPPRTCGPVLDAVRALLAPELSARPAMAEAARLFAGLGISAPAPRSRGRAVLAGTVLAVVLGTAVTARARWRAHLPRSQ